jgi:hypothetical protein
MAFARVELSEVVRYVLERAGESDLDSIAQAVTRRRLALQEKDWAAVTVNATVIIGDVTPAYLRGLTGVVRAITPGRVQYVTITLDQVSTTKLAASARKYAHLVGADSYDLEGVPLGCCTVTKA